MCLIDLACGLHDFIIIFRNNLIFLPKKLYNKKFYLMIRKKTELLNKHILSLSPTDISTYHNP